MWLEYFSQYLGTAFPQFLADKPWNYKDDLCMIGARDLALATGDETWNRYILDNAHWLMSGDGTVANWKEGENNIDKVSFGKSLRILRDLTGDPRYAGAVKKAYAFLERYPRTETGNFWHKDIYPNQVWLDGLYMAMPFYAQTLAETGEDKWDDIMDQFAGAHKLLWDEKLGLYVHGCDVSRKAAWSDPVTGRSPSVWLRAEGWFLMALSDVYELAKDHTDRAEELAVFLKNALDGILKYQDNKTRMFFQVADQPEFPGNYPETSGSAMIAYALMKGARLGMLDDSYGAAGSQVLDGIRDTYLKEEHDAWHLYGICASAGLGAGPDPHNRKNRNGTPDYYVSEARMRDNQHGTGACMMAVSEQLRRGEGN
ncbi:MAG: glycoside hydrolase family 88 protein [Eubacteriales bacterium]|nr:glycoside hydrolase family 88 protein [Eubacteriales bacterium]